MVYKKTINKILKDINAEFDKYVYANQEFIFALEEETKDLKYLEQSVFIDQVRDSWYTYNLSFIFFRSDFFFNDRNDWKPLLFNHEEFNNFIVFEFNTIRHREENKEHYNLKNGRELYSYYCQLRDKKLSKKEIEVLKERIKDLEISNKYYRKSSENKDEIIKNKETASQKYSDEIHTDFDTFKEENEKIEIAFEKLKAKHPNHEDLKKITTKNQIDGFNRNHNDYNNRKRKNLLN